MCIYVTYYSYVQYTLTYPNSLGPKVDNRSTYMQTPFKCSNEMHFQQNTLIEQSLASLESLSDRILEVQIAEDLLYVLCSYDFK